ncbi:MAG: anthranilate/aminodeoxychorismate synthase component II [Planctomycetes bacterium]|nr:anthranilate/aminodeoxychorismate synthase component II [Planctomycetota bacterium]
MILLLDNYDSFTWNLAHLLACDGEPVEVHRCDRITVSDVIAKHPRRIVISPGPGRPTDRGISIELVRRVSDRIPTLGVCLGHQSIVTAFGGRIVRGPEPVHGMARPVHHDGAGVFAGLLDPIVAMRYHSLVVDRASLPDAFVVSAWLDDGTIMGVRHRTRPLVGIQFHPESFLTPSGPVLVRNFLEPVEVGVS